jgi:GNAT superfamily N-acetyltransferase
VTIRTAEPADVPEIIALIRELAEHQREPDAVRNSPEMLQQVLFGPSPRAFAFVVDGPEPGRLAGMAVWFLTYSTWAGVHGVHLEDLYVRPDHRGQGHGRALLSRLAQECTTNGYARLEWSVLAWNTPAIRLYEAVGAEFMDDWRTCRLDGAALDAVAAAGRPGGAA